MSRLVEWLKGCLKSVLTSIVDFLDGIEDVSKRDYHDEQSCEVVCFFKGEDFPFLLEKDLHLSVPFSDFKAYTNGTVILNERGSYNRYILTEIEPSQFRLIEFKRENGNRVKVVHHYVPGVPWGM